MCGIVGAAGYQKDFAKLIYDCLQRLEYRGYDSFGMSFTLPQKEILTFKGAGVMPERTVSEPALTNGAAIGHVRWATHGGVTDANAHPHSDCTGKIAVVHNGVIDNYKELRGELEKRGHVFKSETDTEVIPHLIEEMLKLPDLPLDRAVTGACAAIKGTYALCILHADYPNMVIATRNGSPLVIGQGKDINFASSDALSIAGMVDTILYLEDKDFCMITPYVTIVRDWGGNLQLREWSVPDAAWANVGKGGYPHFMLKEIMEQPKSISYALDGNDEKHRADIDKIALKLSGCRNITMVACGTSRYAAILGRYAISKVAGRSVDVVMASEFEYLTGGVKPGDAVICISQSGETADVVEAAKKAKAAGAMIVSIVNVPGSSLDRLSDHKWWMFCGPEVGVAATKTFTNELVALNLLAYALAGNLKQGFSDMRDIANLIEDNIFACQEKAKAIAEKIKDKEHFYYIGRGPSFSLAGESALKMKEISYIHAEGMPAGELKHGTLSLIEHGTPVAAICPDDETYLDTINNVIEAKTRGAYTIGFTDVIDPTRTCFDDVVMIPTTLPLFYPLVSVVPTQLLAYYTAVAKGLNPDRPRNLAKSVTVK